MLILSEEVLLAFGLLPNKSFNPKDTHSHLLHLLGQGNTALFKVGYNRFEPGSVWINPLCLMPAFLEDYIMTL